MLPSTALVSALSLPVANYSSAHLADLLAAREEGGNETSTIPPRRETSQPSATRIHASPTRRESEWEQQREKVKEGTKNRREKIELKKWKRSGDKVIRERRTSQMTWFLRDSCDLLAEWLSLELLTGDSQNDNRSLLCFIFYSIYAWQECM